MEAVLEVAVHPELPAASDRSSARDARGQLVEPEVTVNGRGEEEYLWVGADDRGVILEIAAVVVEDDVLLVLHVMPRRCRRK